jgi:hypothetical protein
MFVKHFAFLMLDLCASITKKSAIYQVVLF